jgi:hypothetical protein
MHDDGRERLPDTADDAGDEIARTLREISGPPPSPGAAARIAAGAWAAAAPPVAAVPSAAAAPWAVRAAAWMGAAAAGFSFAAWPGRVEIALHAELPGPAPAIAPAAGGRDGVAALPPAPAATFRFSQRLAGAPDDPVLAGEAGSAAEAVEAIHLRVLALHRALEAPPPREMLHARGDRRTRIVVGPNLVLLERDGVREEFPSADALRAARPEVAAEFGSRLDP